MLDLTLPLYQLLVAAFVLGFFTHASIFQRGFWGGNTLEILHLGGILAWTLSAFAFASRPGPPAVLTLLQACSRASGLFLVYLTGFAFSIASYRMLHHRLCDFPGPKLARLSGWWWTWRYAKGCMYGELMALHSEYGDFVRIGPNTLSITDPAALLAINGPGKPTHKGNFFDFALPKVLLNTERDPAKHAARRKAWERAFSVKALKSYEDIMNAHASKLISTLQSHLDAPLDITHTLNHFAFNLMSHFAFSKTYNSAPSSLAEQTFLLTIIHTGGLLVGLLALVPWVFRILRAVPLLGRDLVRFDTYGHRLVSERRASKPAHADVFQHLLNEFDALPDEQKTKEKEMHLEADAMTIAIAGTDTTAAALTAAIWQLATHPEDVQKLREELESIGFSAETPDHSKLGTLTHLRAIVDETLRLSPPAPSVGLVRTTPPEGMRIGSRHVPGGVDLAVPLYVVHHDSRFFVHPEEFLPERWTSRKTELIKDGYTYAPFGIGPYACVGKALALAEIRLAVARVVSAFDVGPGEGMTEDTFRKGQRDCLTLMYSDVMVVFRKRVRRNEDE